MTHNEYQKACMRTANMNYDEYPMLLNGAIGLCGETGEALDILKKHIFQGHELDDEHLASELGDIFWYLAVTAEAAKIELDDIARNSFGKPTMFNWSIADPSKECLLKGLTGVNSYASKILWYATSLYLGDIDGAVSLRTLLIEVYNNLKLAGIAIDYSVFDIYDLNIEKLKKRYPDGFDKEHSLNRKEGDI